MKQFALAPSKNLIALSYNAAITVAIVKYQALCFMFVGPQLEN